MRGKDPGELVGGFGDIVRSREQIADVLAIAKGWDASASPPGTRSRRQGADYLRGVIATLEWVLRQRNGAPITSQRRGVTATELKAERLHAEDVIDRAGQPWVRDLPHREYGEGVKATINWLLGDSTIPPVYQRCDARDVQSNSLYGPGDPRA